MLTASLALEDDALADPVGGVMMETGPGAQDELLGRANIYRILSGVFVEETAPQFLAALREASSLQALRDAGLAFDADFLDADLTALTDALACEYATLFASSGGFPPIESVRLTGRFKQEPHFQVAKLYQRMGFAQVQGRFAVFPDQLGIELMFVAELLERCASALAQGDVLAFRRWEKEVRRFWALHLGRWVRGYSALIERAAGHSFYREMARFLNGFAEEEIAAMGLTHLDDLDQGRLEVPKSEIKLEFNPDDPVCGECPPDGPDAAPSPTSARVIPITPLQDLRF